MAPNPANLPQTPPVDYDGPPELLAGPSAIIPPDKDNWYTDCDALVAGGLRDISKYLISDPKELKELEERIRKFREQKNNDS